MKNILKITIMGIATALLFITFVALVYLMPILWAKVGGIMYDFIFSLFDVKEKTLFEFWCLMFVGIGNLLLIPIFLLPIVIIIGVIAICINTIINTIKNL